MTSEEDDTHNKVRSLIVWGLSHDYNRVLTSLRQAGADLINEPNIDQLPEIKFSYSKYSKRCDELEELLQRLGNILNDRKTEEVASLLQPQKQSVDDLIAGLLKSADKIGRIADAAPLEARTKQKAGILVRQTRRARDQMLALWSMPFNRIKTQPISFRVKKELWRVLADLNSVFVAHGSSIRENVDIASERILSTDRTMFAIAVSNIVANAVVHSGMRKQLKIRIVESVEAADDKYYLCLAVSDNGPGIPPEEQQNIFLLFRQGERGLASEGGSGVGLTFAQFAMDLVGGSLSLEANPGGGATFVLKFPTTKEALG